MEEASVEAVLSEGEATSISAPVTLSDSTPRPGIFMTISLFHTLSRCILVEFYMIGIGFIAIKESYVSRNRLECISKYPFRIICNITFSYFISLHFS